MIVILNGTRELVILPSEIPEMTLFFSGKVGRKCRKRIKLYVNVGNSGAKSCSTFSTTLGPITDLSRDYRKRLRSLISSPDVPSLR